MQKIVLISFLIMIALGTNHNTSADVDYTKIGVSNGDGFNFMIEEYSQNSNGETTNEMSIAVDMITGTDDILLVPEGGLFRMIVGNAEPNFEPRENGGFDVSVVAIFEYKDKAVPTKESLDGKFISSRDWAGKQVMKQTEIDDLQSRYNGTPNIVFIDTKSEFGYQISYDLTSTNNSNFANIVSTGEIIFNKNTGIMKNYNFTTSTLIEFNNTSFSFEEKTIMRYIPDPVSDGFISLGGFEVTIGIFGISALVLLKRNRPTKD